MMKRSIPFLLTFCTLVIAGCSDNTPDVQPEGEVTENPVNAENNSTMSFHDFKVETLEGEAFDLARLKGSKVMVVNTASECGYTPQYQQLQELYDELGGDSFTIVGFPANNFGGQEPGTNEEIRSFCSKNYGVSFPMMSKISVKGADQHELYQFLTQKEKNGVSDFDVKWNFHKFLIDENGQVVRDMTSGDSPLDQQVIDWIKGKANV